MGRGAPYVFLIGQQAYAERDSLEIGSIGLHRQVLLRDQAPPLDVYRSRKKIQAVRRNDFDAVAQLVPRGADWDAVERKAQ